MEEPWVATPEMFWTSFKSTCEKNKIYFFACLLETSRCGFEVLRDYNVIPHRLPSILLARIDTAGQGRRGLWERDSGDYGQPSG